MLHMLLAKKRAADRRAWLEAKGNLAEVIWRWITRPVAGDSDDSSRSWFWNRPECRVTHSSDPVKLGEQSS
jgi:hypothetical protein